MDKYVSEQYKNMLERTEAAAEEYIRELPEDKQAAAEMVKIIYQNELEEFLTMFLTVTGEEKSTLR